MVMAPRMRALSLTAHVSTSIGWLGAVATFLAMAIVGVARHDAETARSMYVAMNVTTWLVIVPLCLVALLTGVTQSLGTSWGLFRHYWVVVKLALTGVATVVLFIHTQPIDRVAQVALAGALDGGTLWSVRMQLIGDASAALAVLMVATALSVYKPWGLTPYGIGQQMARGPNPRAIRRSSAGKYVLIAMAIGLSAIVLLHLFGMGLHAH